MTIKKSTVDSANIEPFRECAIFEVSVENFNRVYLVVVACKSFITLRDSQYACITAVTAPISDF